MFLVLMGSFSSSGHLLYPRTHFSHAPGDYFVPYGIISLSMQENAQKMLKSDKLTLKSKESKVKFNDFEKLANCSLERGERNLG